MNINKIQTEIKKIESSSFAKKSDKQLMSYEILSELHKSQYKGIQPLALVKYNDTEIRRLTIQELRRIQSFPDDYKIEGTKKDIIMQIGNAVACRFAYHLGKYIINTLQ